MEVLSTSRVIAGGVSRPLKTLAVEGKHSKRITRHGERLVSPVAYPTKRSSSATLIVRADQEETKVIGGRDFGP